MPPLPRAVRVACVTSCSRTLGVVQEALTTALPNVSVLLVDPTLMRGVPTADCAVVDAVVGEHAGIDVVRALRAAGFAGGTILLLAEPPSPALVEGANRMGTRALLSFDRIAGELAGAVVAALPPNGPRPTGGASLPAGGAAASTGTGAINAMATQAHADLRRTQQLLAAGEIAVRLRHAVANPLAALLMELELMARQPLDAEQRESVLRMLELCSRAITAVRPLESLAMPPGMTSPMSGLEGDEGGERVAKAS